MKKFSNILSKIFSANSLVWIFPFLLIVPNIILDITEYSSPLVKITNILLPLGVYLTLMSMSRNSGRTSLFLFPVLFYAAFQIVLIYLYGESIISVDMFINMATTNVSEATELLGNLAIAIITVVFLYIPPIVWAIILISKHRKATTANLRQARIYGGVILTTGVIMLILCYCLVKTFNISRDIFPVNVINNTITAVKRTAATEKYYSTSSNFTYKATSGRDASEKEIYVLVIGETSRADNWQLFGYNRPTTPRLAQRLDNMVIFPKTLSESNTTHKSVPLLLSWCTAENFGDSIFTSKSLVSAFNEAGYHTAFLSNQGRNHSFIDFFAREAQTTEFLHDDSKHHFDSELIAPMKKFIANSPSDKILVVLHTYGSHFNYKDRYPENYAYFTPDDNSEATASNRPELMNAYDNTIRYTDAVLDSVISVVEEQDCAAAVMYLSDHGEDIFDDPRGRFLHASPVPTFEQLHVPMFVWTSTAFSETHPDLVEAMKQHSGKNVTSSRVVFDTMLALAGINTPYADAAKALCSPLYHRGKRTYLNDYNEGVDLHHSGFRSYDFDELKKHSISEQ